MTAAPGDTGAPFPGSIEIDGVVCYTRDDEPGTWRYVPRNPVPEMAGERPTLQAWVSPQGGILQLGAEWTVRSDALTHLKEALSKATGVREFDLQPAPAAVRQATLEVGDGAGGFEIVASSSSSGFPPYRAIYRVDLDAARKNAVVAALNGRTGFLVVRYGAAATVKVWARTRISGEVSAALDTLAPSSSPAEIRAWVNEAIGSGQLELAEESSAGAPDALKQRARSLGVEKFSMLLAAKVRQAKPKPPDPDARTDTSGPAEPITIAAEAFVSDIVQQELERVGDVSEWFGPGEGPSHITTIPGPGPGPGPGPSPAEVTVGLGFPTTELPLAFAEARCGEKKVVLRAPEFKPARLDVAGCDEGLTVTTHYNTGDQPFRTQAPIADAERLPPGVFGLVAMVVDATERQEAGAREVRVRLQFRPSGPGSSEDRTFYLRDQTWVASFFVVTRGEPIAGEVELEWKETTKEGQIRRHQLTAKDQAVFVLRSEPHQGAKP